MDRLSYDQLEASLMETCRIHGFAAMFEEMQGILDQARAESAWWSPARCRGILADLRRIIATWNKRFLDGGVPYTTWDLNFGALTGPLWTTIHSESWEGLYELNVRVQRARFLVNALVPLLNAGRTVHNLRYAMEQLDEGSAETDDPNQVSFDWRESPL